MTFVAGIGKAPGEPSPPPGFEVVLDRRVRRVGAGMLVGGWPTRMLRLAPAAQEALSTGRFAVGDARTARLARRLIDAGMAHPEPRATAYAATDVTIVVPVRDRPEMLKRLLGSLGGGPPVVIVDDGSTDGATIEAIAAKHAAAYMRHPSARGPGAARNTGLRTVRTPLVAFIDSDCVARPDWLGQLLAHFDDPAVALVAPRIVALRDPTSWRDWLTAYEKVRSSLDLGPDEALVVPRGRVPWVPSAALLARCSALGAGFAEDLRVGEDVDLVWRLQKAGWRVRYEPASQVAHEHRTTWSAWAKRKAHYGTSAAVLGQRHGRQVAPVVVAPWAAASWSLLMAQRRASVLGPIVITVVAGARLAWRLPVFPGRLRTASALMAMGFTGSGLQVASALVRAWWPLAVPACALSRRARRAVLVAGIVDGLADWARHGRPTDPFSYVLLRRADDLAYGAGLWLGAWRARSVVALLPDISLKPGDSRAAASTAQPFGPRGGASLVGGKGGDNR